MDPLYHLNVDQVRDFLPNQEMTYSNPHVPVLSTESAQIFEKIHPLIPNSTDQLLTVKTIDKSATDITAKVAEVNELKKNATKNKILSILACVGSVVLLAAVIAIGVGAFIFCAGTLAGILIPAYASVLLTLPIAAIVGSAIYIHSAFNSLPKAKNELTAAIDLAHINHEKIKTYFNDNYRSLQAEIQKSIDQINHDYEILNQTIADFSEVKDQLQSRTDTLEKALIELEHHHEFYLESTNA